MPIPVTLGSCKTNHLDMAIGDYIAFKYNATAGTAGTFPEFGVPLSTAQANEIPVAGSAAPNGYAYALKVAPGLLVSERVVQHSISWDVLNAAKFIQGCTLSSLSCVPKMTSNTTPFGIASSSSAYSAAFDAFTAFNGYQGGPSEGCWATSSGTNTGWLAYEFATEKVINSYSIISRNMNEPTALPKNWTFEGSNDGISWTILDTRENIINWTISAWRTFDFKNTTKYKRYRINITANNGLSEYICIGELTMREFGVPSVRSLSGGVAYLGADGKPSLTNANLGAWPPINEWDRFIVGSNLNGKITAGDDNVWHHTSVGTWSSSTPVVSLKESTYRIGRVKNTGFVFGNPSSYSGSAYGFRPVFEFLEADAKASNFWY